MNYEKSKNIFKKVVNKAHIIDEDGNKYIDFIQSWRPMILKFEGCYHGHAGTLFNFFLR